MSPPVHDTTRELYRVITDGRGHLAIQCATCGHVCWNETNRREAYCDTCHSYLLEEIGWPPERRDDGK